jgi:hypothetical protein
MKGTLKSNTTPTTWTGCQCIPHGIDAGFPLWQPGFAYGQHVMFVVDKVALGQVFSKQYSVSSANHSTDFSIIIITWC